MNAQESYKLLEDFLSGGPATVLTGAGVSVDSGIRAYRGKDGRYMNPNYQPILYQQLMAPGNAGKAFRDIGRGHILGIHLVSKLSIRVCRSSTDSVTVREAKPNIAHYSLTALEHHGFVNRLITQNVDGLHARSGFPKEKLLELHGTLFVVKCRQGHELDRDEFQDMLSEANPSWKAFVDDMNAQGESLRTNPDGDIELEGRSYEDFVIPPCPTCLKEGRHETTIKPDVVFFGETIPEYKKQQSLQEILDADRFLVVATTMATYSAYRLLQLAHQNKKPIVIVNIGPTRGDHLQLPQIELPCGDVLKECALRLSRPNDDQGRRLLDVLRSWPVTTKI
ncbi:NAD-dependent protein deacylase SIR4 {ECO:0000255/HAMAP-Rule:MF_03161} {ECO:0000255/HAMAP-Rule:MF_03161}; AltName: Full=Regulatory protein SIR2 homolog 4 {ECO:0000255/HAMAP-Rule:MF_03161}; Flags: Precursor [Serendipita indica DSM 11827]|nr:NAD-dependent protein deacylase SIR4 {ECO:0000255/HAMAP-Rule:MF_03161} {ECO:0000255/HAMAP-Rule:MF_03161}; AltName: Full=Regulatory protein SIR2 homolog 4 {ECO:0000255/HAMAP-Rule:MF_03161}; Flags: Precursor [Serendipita indica DSM 11827]